MGQPQIDMNDDELKVFVDIKKYNKKAQTSQVISSLIFFFAFVITITISFQVYKRAPELTSIILIIPALIILLSVYKVLSRKTKPTRNTITDNQGHIVIASRSITIPRFLLNNKFKNNSSPHLTLSIENIKDFEAVSGSKDNPSYFRIELHRKIQGEDLIEVRHNLSKHSIRTIFKRLHQESNLPEEKSPFSEHAIGIRKQKTSAYLLYFVLLFACIGCSTFITIMSPLLYRWTGYLNLLIFSIPLALVATAIMRFTVFKKSFKAGFGREMNLGTLMSLGIAISYLLSLGFNVVGHSNSTKTEAEVTKKKVTSSKNSKNYYLILDLQYPNNGKFYQFAEHPKIRVSYSEFTKVKAKKTMISLTIKDGALGVPFVADYGFVKGTTKKRSKKRKSKRKSSKKLKALKTWKAEIPSFPKPDSYMEVKWPNGQIKSKEPRVNGNKHGVAYYFHANGQKYTEINWVNNYKHGRYKTYRDDGTLEGDYSYNQGQIHGLIKWYDQKGELKQQAIYKNGHRID